MKKNQWTSEGTAKSVVFHLVPLTFLPQPQTPGFPTLWSRRGENWQPHSNLTCFGAPPKASSPYCCHYLASLGAQLQERTLYSNSNPYEEIKSTNKGNVQGGVNTEGLVLGWSLGTQILECPYAERPICLLEALNTHYLILIREADDFLALGAYF